MARAHPAGPKTDSGRDRGGLMRHVATAGAVAAVLLIPVLFPSASTAAEPTRAEYVAQMETICKPGSEATQRAVRGTRVDVRSERLSVAARKVAKAQRIFAGTVRSISKVPRPAAD